MEAVNTSSTRSFVRRLIAVVAAVLLVGVLLHSAAGGNDPGDRSFPRSLAVAALAALTIWAIFAARSRIRKQTAAAIELLPPQPGDVGGPLKPRIGGHGNIRNPRGGRSATGVRPRRSTFVGRAGRRLVLALRRNGRRYLSAELAGLHGKVKLAATSASSYEAHLEPILREIASARAPARGARLDEPALAGTALVVDDHAHVDEREDVESRRDLAGLVDLDSRLPEETGFHGVLMRFPPYRRWIITREISRIIQDIEEL